MKKLIAIAICTCMCVCFFAGCSKDGDDPIENPNQPEPEKPAEVTLKLSTEDLAFEAKGGWKEFTINSSAVWTISGGNTWCQPGVTTGTGITQVKVMVEAYTGTTDRNAVLTVKAGSLSVTLTVTQKAVHALTLTKDKFDVPQEGGDIDIEVKSNINYTVSIPTAFQEWIKEAPKSKAMETKSFRFTVAANEEAEKREGYIVISGNELKDTVYVYQAEGRCLILDKDSCTLSAREQELTVELRTNVDYEVVVPDSVSGWVSCPPESRALRTDKLRLLIGENGLEEERQAVVIVKDRNSELADTLHIRQNQANALILGQKAYDVPAEGGTINVELTTNIDYKVVIPDSVSGWVSRMPESRALRTDRLGFLIGENDLTKGRQAVVIIQDQDSELADTLHIRQSGKGEPEEPADPFPNTHFRLGYKANSATTVTFTVHLPWEATVTYESEATGWLSVSPTSGEAGKATLQLTGTTTNEASTERNAYIDITYGDKTQRLTVTQRAYGETDITDQFDPEFARVLQEKGFIRDATAITEEEVKGITILALSYKGLTSLRGIEYFTALTGLDCNHNELTTLDVSNNTALEILYCNYNELTTLDVSKNIALDRLECGGNNLTTLDVSKNTALTYLSVWKNKLTTLDVSKNTALIELYCNYNELTTLDVNKNTALNKLNCGYNQLTTLNVSGCPALTELNCGANQLSTLDISKNTALTRLDCYNNQLTALDVSNNTALTGLGCFENQLTTLDVSNNTALTALNCKGNQLTALDVRQNLRLNALQCQDNPGNGTTFLLKAWFDRNDMPQNMSTAWNHNNKYITVEFQKTDTVFAKTDYSLDYKAHSSKVDFFVPNAWKASIIYEENDSEWLSLSTMSGEAGRAILDLTTTKNTKKTKRKAYLDITYGNKQQRLTITQQAIKGNITDRFDPEFARVLQKRGSIPDANAIAEEDVKGITFLDLSNNVLTSLRGIEYFTALTGLDCKRNQLTTLDVSNNTALTYLNCEGNQLTTLDVSNNTALTKLDCSNNQLTTLDVSNNTALTTLACSGNQLTTLNVSKNTALTTLDVWKNKLTPLDVSKNTALIQLICDDNQITTLDVSNNTRLTYLYCSRNQLTTLDVSNNTALTTLYCSSNQLTTLDVSNNTALRELDCQKNPGNGNIFPLITWFDENSIPNSLTIKQKKWYDNIYLITVQIIKAGSENSPYLNLDKKELVMDADGGETSVSVKTNVEYDVVIPEEAKGWIACTNAGSEKTQFKISANTSTNAREAKVALKAKGKELSDTLHIRQKAKQGQEPGGDTEHFPKTDYEIGYQTGSTVIEFSVPSTWKASITYEGISGWLSITPTAGEAGMAKITANADENLTYFRRKAYINITYGDKIQQVTVTQETEPNLANYFDPKFAKALQEKGYIPNAYSIYAKQLKGIKALDVRSSELTTLRGIEYFTALTYLDCSSNELTELDVSKCTELDTLHVAATPLKTLDVSKNTKLILLDCANNDLTTLNVSGCTALRTLWCFTNSLTTLDVSECTALRALWCSSNKLTTLDVSKNTALTRLNCSPSRQLTTLNVTGCKALDYLNCSECQLSTLNTSGCSALTYLNCTINKQLTTLNVSGCSALKTLDCANNPQLSTLNVSGCSALETLACQNNPQLSTLNVSECTALTLFDCSDCKLTALDISQNTALTHLNCGSNKLTTLNIGQNTALTQLNCTCNLPLTALDVSRCTALTHLNCSACKIPMLNVSRCSVLTYLNCSACELSMLDVSGCTKLSTLDCGGNPGDGETSFPLTTWVKGNKPQWLTIKRTSWTWLEPDNIQKTITITYQ